MRTTRILTVYERPGCHLCDDMVVSLAEWRAELDFEIERVDVDRSPELADRYGARVPVLVLGSAEICHYFLDLHALRRSLGADMSGPSRTRKDPHEPTGPGEDAGSLRGAGRYRRIYAIIRKIPRGRVATYGQVAAIEGSCTPRMVGYALAALPASDEPDVPWQRVLNRTGTVSERSGGGGIATQRRALEADGVLFDAGGRVDFDAVGWDGPDIDWIDRNGFHPAPRPRSAGAPRRA